ncbi:hypothetical protein [Hymenobacter negativus]|uniref:Uncharacterized protein n=1 Tax=Hymenobacter negativus TaxID=2795026 RepID=A0ABS3QLI6_9BACT|nr:hypothetical protein [Hymenobacter negativus]MBO2011883.1 hypothetical protein [Hymenobacter negativus]
MKNLVSALLVALFSLLAALPKAQACAWCRPRVEAGIHDAAYGQRLLLVLLPVALLLAAGLGLFFWDKRWLRYGTR